MKHLVFVIFSLSGLIYEALAPSTQATSEVLAPQIALHTDSIIRGQAFELGSMDTDLNCISEHLVEVERKIEK